MNEEEGDDEWDGEFDDDDDDDVDLDDDDEGEEEEGAPESSARAALRRLAVPDGGYGEDEDVINAEDEVSWGCTSDPTFSEYHLISLLSPSARSIPLFSVLSCRSRRSRRQRGGEGAAVCGGRACGRGGRRG